MRISDVVFASVLLAAAPCWAADVTDAVPGHPGVTYEMLLKQVVPDLAQDAAGNWSSTHVPHLRGTDGKPDTETDLAFKDIETLTVKAGGRARLLLLTGDSQSDSDFMSILAVFDPATKIPKLLDYMDVGGDRFSSFSQPATLAISADTDAFITDANHFDSGQNYSIDTALYLDGDKLRLAFSQFTLNQGACGYEMRQVPVYTTQPDGHAKYRAITDSVTQTVTATDETCDAGTTIPKPSKHTYTNLYRWDAKKNRYATGTNAMTHLMQPDQ